MTPIYTTVAALQALPGCASIGDADAEDLIVRAEDLADDMLGGWPVDDATGRKIVEADVDAWRWARLGRFTARLAARMYTNPEAFDGVQWSSVSGPDFAFSGPRGGGWEQRIGTELVALLNGTGLRRLSSRMTGRRVHSSATAYWNDSDNWDDGYCP